MKQRLGIACALVHNPELIILDEPTNGLDPQGIADVRNLILSLSKDEGKTVVVSSHLLSEIEVVADSMLIIDKGKKVAEGKAAHLLNPADTMVLIATGNNAAAKEWLRETQWSSLLQPGSDLRLKIHRDEVPLVIQGLVQQGVAVYSIRSKHSLEALFLTLTTANQHVDAYPA